MDNLQVQDNYVLNLSSETDAEFYSECCSIVYACHIFAESDHICHWKHKMIITESNKRQGNIYQRAKASVEADLSR